jgi:uncharacterized protein (UPF0335 family)
MGNNLNDVLEGTDNGAPLNSESMGGNVKEKLKAYVARIERLEAEKTELTADIREVYAESKTFGFDTKILRKTIALRKIDAAERAEQEALLDLYLDAVGLN